MLYKNKQMFYTGSKQKKGGIAHAGQTGSCCFTGHRPAKLPWGMDETDARCLRLKAQIADALEAAYQSGYRHFICGMALGCDLYFCEAALALRAQYPGVTVEAALPCPTQTEGWPPGAAAAPCASGGGM